MTLDLRSPLIVKLEVTLVGPLAGTIELRTTVWALDWPGAREDEEDEEEEEDDELVPVKFMGFRLDPEEAGEAAPGLAAGEAAATGGLAATGEAAPGGLAAGEAAPGGLTGLWATRDADDPGFEAVEGA